ncbi:MAG: NAD(P)-binding protein [Sphaerochaeta sp.]|nr:NAD(P)-binding protein [Sphaerochaeta sp.]
MAYKSRNGRTSRGHKHYEYIIVGLGLSGLTAAAHLSKAGFSVLVLEKTPTCGGLLNSFSRDGYVFDLEHGQLKIPVVSGPC